MFNSNVVIFKSAFISQHTFPNATTATHSRASHCMRLTNGLTHTMDQKLLELNKNVQKKANSFNVRQSNSLFVSIFHYYL